MKSLQQSPCCDPAVEAFALSYFPIGFISPKTLFDTVTAGFWLNQN